MKYKIPILLIILTFINQQLLAENNENRISFNKPGVVGQVTHMNINNIDLPMNNQGSNGEDGQSYYPNGQTSLSFLFSGGFCTSAYVGGQLRASWMAPASLIEEWQPGKWGMDPGDGLAKFYVVNSSDGPGSPNYIDWANAVALGADFQDLNGDGVYDPNVDRPDMLGDRVIWTVINDGTSLSVRTPRLGTDPVGLEIHQQAWAFSRADELGDVIFFRYRIINPTNENKDDLIFTVWADPDLGEAQDDRIGCDTTRSLGFIYNDADDPNYGANPPAFGMDFFQGPIIESPGDTAFLYRGPYFGIDTLYDYLNLPMTSYMYYIQSDRILGDPDNAIIARNYQEGGLDKLGNPIDPTAWGVGGTPTTNNRYVYSGDPGNSSVGRSPSGWIDITPSDKRFMLNTGPFQLAVGDTQDIVVAYVVAQENSAEGSLDKLKLTDDVAQQAYNANFFVAGPPPAPKVTSRIFDNKIELIIDLKANGTWDYDQVDDLLNRQVFEAIKVYQFKSNNPGDVVGTTPNSTVIGRYDLDNQYGAIYLPRSNGTVEIAWSGFQNISTDADIGNIRMVIENDVFANNSPLVNFKEYYFAVTATSLNYTFAFPYEVTATPNDYIVSGAADWLESSRQSAFIAVTPGTSEFSPFPDSASAAEYTGSRAEFHEGLVYYDLVDKNDVTGHDYKVSFFSGGNLWRLTDLNTDEIMLDSMSYQGTSSQAWNFPIIDGVSVRVVNVADELDTVVTVATNPSDVWVQGTGLYEENGQFDGGINLVKHEKPTFSTLEKQGYFPVRILFDTVNVAKGYAYLGDFNQMRFIKDIFIDAYDISDPDNPRRLNITYKSTPPFDFRIASNIEIIIMKSDYNENNYYTGPRDSLFNADAYLLMNLKPIADSLYQSAKFALEIFPNFPNSDVDEFQFNTASFLQEITLDQRKDLLQNVKVVPNPYWGYSQYETSYDNPQVKFTHLDRRATIRIFNLAGQLVRTIEKNSDANEIYWDLRNDAGLKVASGMYITHIEVPDVGEKVLKFAIIQREERIDRY